MRISEKPIREYPFFVRLIMWAQKKKYGEALLPARMWGRSPKLLYGLQVLYRALDRKNSPIEPLLRTLINVRVSQINDCAFCIDIGSALSLKRGGSMEKIKALQDISNKDFNREQVSQDHLFSERELTALVYADAMTNSNKKVDDNIFENLKSQFNEDEIIELTALIGYQNLSSKFNAALNIPSQGFCLIPRIQK